MFLYYIQGMKKKSTTIQDLLTEFESAIGECISDQIYVHNSYSVSERDRLNYEHSRNEIERVRNRIIKLFNK